MKCNSILKVAQREDAIRKLKSQVHDMQETERDTMSKVNMLVCDSFDSSLLHALTWGSMET